MYQYQLMSFDNGIRAVQDVNNSEAGCKVDGALCANYLGSSFFFSTNLTSEIKVYQEKQGDQAWGTLSGNVP